MIEFISQPWHWAVSGTILATVMFLLLYFGKSFGMSATLRAACSMGGAGKKISFFDFNWRLQTWNLVFAMGAILGGWIASTYLASPEPVAISEATRAYLAEFSIQVPTTMSEGTGYVPMELFNTESFFSPAGILLFVLGGFFVGFGARYAGGCTSGHAISGLSNLQLPSLIAVVGFFLGGLLMVHLILPTILNLFKTLA